MNPELLMIESDHDLRNSADFLVIDKIAKAIFRVSGIGRVQAITRPEGTPIEHTSIPFQISMQGVSQQMNQKYQEDQMADMLKQATMMDSTINSMVKMQNLTKQMSDDMHVMVQKMHSMTIDVAELRDHMADFEDFFRPIRSYFYWEKHCFDIPVCWSLRSVFDGLDGIDTMTDDIESLLPVMDNLDKLMPQLTALMPEMIANMKDMKTTMLTMYSTQKGLQDQQNESQKNSAAMGKAFDESKNDDSFYLPPETFNNAEFKRGMKNFISPDGHAVRFIISHQGDPMTPEGISHIDGDQARGAGGIEGHAAGGLEDLPRWYGGDLQGHERRQQLRLADRRNRFAVPDFHHHADHHAQCGGVSGDRRHRVALAGCVVRACRCSSGST